MDDRASLKACVTKTSYYCSWPRSHNLSVSGSTGTTPTTLPTKTGKSLLLGHFAALLAWELGTEMHGIPHLTWQSLHHRGQWYISEQTQQNVADKTQPAVPCPASNIEASYSMDVKNHVNFSPNYLKKQILINSFCLAFFQFHQRVQDTKPSFLRVVFSNHLKVSKQMTEQKKDFL